MRWFLIAVILLTAGCESHTFTDLGNGTAVPSESIDDYAKEHGVSHEAARKLRLAEMEAAEKQPATP